MGESIPAPSGIEWVVMRRGLRLCGCACCGWTGPSWPTAAAAAVARATGLAGRRGNSGLAGRRALITLPRMRDTGMGMGTLPPLPLTTGAGGNGVPALRAPHPPTLASRPPGPRASAGPLLLLAMAGFPLC